MCPGCARTFAHKTFFDNHVSLCGTGNESEPEEEPEDEPPEDEPEEQPEEQPEDEPRIVPFYDQSDRSSLAVPSHEALGSISPSLQAEVAAVEKFVTEHCAEIIAGITHGEAPMYEPVRAHAEALRNLERTSCLLVVSTVPAVYNCFIAIELPAHLGGWRRPVRFGLWSQWLTCLQDSSCAQAWLGRRWHSGRPRPRPYGGARLEITSQPVSAVGVGAVGGG